MSYNASVFTACVCMCKIPSVCIYMFTVFQYRACTMASALCGLLIYLKCSQDVRICIMLLCY